MIIDLESNDSLLYLWAATRRCVVWFPFPPPLRDIVMQTVITDPESINYE